MFGDTLKKGLKLVGETILDGAISDMTHLSKNSQVPGSTRDAATSIAESLKDLKK